MMPIVFKMTGTGTSTAIIPDIMQNPFNIGIGLALLTGGLSTAYVAIEHSMDFSTVMQPSFNGLTARMPDGTVSTAVWFQNSGATGGTTQIGTTLTVGLETSGLNCNYAFPVAAIRVNVASATATSVVVASFLQAVNAP